MKFSILLDILFELLTKRRVTALYLSEKYALSPRTVYRYVELLSKSVPLQVKRGRSGGIRLADQYKLPTGFFTSEEYQTLIEALSESYTQRAETRFLSVLKKLDLQARESAHDALFTADAADILFYENQDLPPALTEKLRILQTCMQTLTMADIEYQNELQTIEPHSLVFTEKGWGMYAFSHAKREFFLFPVNGISSIVKLNEPFRKRPFELPEFSTPKAKLPVRLAISQKGLERAQNWLGAETVKRKKGGYVADVLLPDNEELPAKILSFGQEVKVITPASLKNKVVKLAEEIMKLY